MSAEAAIRFKARVAGFFYFLLFPFGALSFLARRGIVIKGDAAATAAGLLSHETAWRMLATLAEQVLDLPKETLR